jgi:hypothetical protein
MAKDKFEASSRLESALSRVLESEPKKWGAADHLAMLRYLVLECSDAAKATVQAVDGKNTLVLDGKPVDTITVKWSTLKEEFGQTGKLAECANWYKWLQEVGNMAKADAAVKEEYA